MSTLHSIYVILFFMKAKEEGVREHHYFMDKEGRLFFQGNQIRDPWVYGFFHRSLRQTKEGRFLVICENEHCYIEVEDVPYVINDINVIKDENGEISRIELLFNGGYKETLDPSTLFVGKENVLYCRVRKGVFLARFNRKSYYHIVNLIEYNDKAGEFQIRMNNRPYTIASRSF
ncbi:MAG TPA: hypothetical protein VNK81_08430 [Thermodesulfobacteriota bacterium]|nr:hypothetical protein [Thermodesulfobacteriota bacterium]